MDESISVILKFSSQYDSSAAVVGIASASLRVADNYDNHTPVVRFQGDHGEIQIFGKPWRPSHLHVIQREQGFDNKGTLVHEFDNCIHADVYGLAYEADEVARCIRDSKLQSTIMPWDESLIIMEIMDKVRKDNGLGFSEAVETTEYVHLFGPRSLKNEMVA